MYFIFHYHILESTIMLVPVWATKILLYLYFLPADDQSISLLASWIFSISFKLAMATYALQFFLSILVSRSSEYGLKQATLVSLSWTISWRWNRYDFSWVSWLVEVSCLHNHRLNMLFVPLRRRFSFRPFWYGSLLDCFHYWVSHE